MKVIQARNVNHAWAAAIRLMNEVGVPEPSRNGPVLVAPFPVTTVYNWPWERVLFDSVRDANPIFHLHESLWMLAGRDDATWLDQFVHDFSARFAEEDGVQHGAYGARWRDLYGYDQLDAVVRVLSADTGSRQAVIQMWSAEADLEVPGLKDRPCNTQIYLRVVDRGLELGVTCRSNDIVWGAYGANAVHFSFLQEYLAARLGLSMGKMYQISWNWHMYESTRHLADLESAMAFAREYPGDRVPLVHDADTFDVELRDYLNDPDSAVTGNNKFLADVARPMFKVNEARKAKDYDKAFHWVEGIKARDWRDATAEWLARRKK